MLITKGDRRGFRGVDIVEVLWKTITITLNWRLTSYIQLHDVIHVLWSGRGMDTASLKSNMLQHTTSMKEAVLHDILLDIQKVYNSLDKDRCLNIFSGCGVGPRSLRFLRTY